MGGGGVHAAIVELVKLLLLPTVIRERRIKTEGLRLARIVAVAVAFVRWDRRIV